MLCFYKDRGGPAQLGIRDWAGLKGPGHIDDRNSNGFNAHWFRNSMQERVAPGGGLIGAAQTGTVLSFFS